MKRRYRFQFEIQTIHVSDTENVVMTKIWNEDNDGDIRNSCLQLHCSILVDIKHDLCTLYQRWSRAFYSWHHIVGFFSLIFGPHTSVCLSHFFEQSNVNLKKKNSKDFLLGFITFLVQLQYSELGLTEILMSGWGSNSGLCWCSMQSCLFSS